MELDIAYKQLALQNEERELRAAELVIANKELAFQNGEKEKRAIELLIANKELAFQHEEKEKRAAELVIANKELIFQNEEKERRATELLIANKELAFQHAEKEKRANELIESNRELVFQHAEKEKRATELAIANHELVFQNNEKEKRANELIVANKELIFQNKEKERRAAELIIANTELAFQNSEKERRAAEMVIANEELATRTAELVAANKELESFSYSVSHDMRAPLRAIHGYSRMLKEDCETSLSQESHRLINNIITNTIKMGRLIDELLTFSRLGRKELVVVSIPMHQMVVNHCKEISQENPDRSIDFRIDKLLPGHGDSAALKQVWINLISNAVKYSGGTKTAIIKISSKVQGDEIIYSIQDNGAGFDMRYADKLFGVFQRLHTEEEFEGTGVGLAIVHRIVSKHGGRVWADGKVGEGSTFYFTLLTSML